MSKINSRASRKNEQRSSALRQPVRLHRPPRSPSGRGVARTGLSQHASAHGAMHERSRAGRPRWTRSAPQSPARRDRLAYEGPERNFSRGSSRRLESSARKAAQGFGHRARGGGAARTRRSTSSANTSFAAGATLGREYLSRPRRRARDVHVRAAPRMPRRKRARPRARAICSRLRRGAVLRRALRPRTPFGGGVRLEDRRRRVQALARRAPVPGGALHARPRALPARPQPPRPQAFD